MSSSAKLKSHRALSLLNLVFLLLFAGMLGWGLTHHSGTAEVLGRYSTGYAAFLGVLGLIVLLQLYLMCCAGQRAWGWAGNIYTLVITTVVMVGLVELMLRVVNPWGMDFFHQLPYHMQGMVDDPELGYRHPRNVSYRLGDNRVELNDQGLRDQHTPYAKPAGERRIVVLGDSVAFGWGVDQGENFSDRMEPLLAERSGTPWQVVNGGVNGYNTEQQRSWLLSDGLRYQPDVVLLVYVINDTDAVFDPNANTWRRHPEWPPSLPEALNRLRQLSFLFQGTNMFARLAPVPGRGASAGEGGDQGPPSVTDKPRWPQSKQALIDIAAVLEQRGIPFLVARNSGSDPRFFDQLEAAGIAAITLDPAWGRVPADIAHVSRVDPHPSAPVHAEMAAVLVDELEQRGWLAAKQATP